jgi:type I site-specific restriction-modification system R (restriction) subunit
LRNFENNSFHVVTELTCKNGEDEFRPDITLLINGMPLAFIEVKKTEQSRWYFSGEKPDQCAIPKQKVSQVHQYHSASRFLQ